MSPAVPTKPCAVCGRTITWRRTWQRDWEQVRYCSDACRRAGVTPVDTALEDAVLRLLAARPAGATICPSEAARRLVVRGEVEITQGGRVVDDPSRAKGPIRVRRRRTG